MGIELYDRLWRQYHKHYQRVYGIVQQDPRYVWRRTLRSYERTYRHLMQNLPQGTRVLDIGCGTGVLLKWLTEYHPEVVPVGNVMGLYHRYHDLTHRRSFADHSLLQLMDIGGFKNATIVPIKLGSLIARMRHLIEALRLPLSVHVHHFRPPGATILTAAASAACCRSDHEGTPGVIGTYLHLDLSVAHN